MIMQTRRHQPARRLTYWQREFASDPEVLSAVDQIARDVATRYGRNFDDVLSEARYALVIACGRLANDQGDRLSFVCDLVRRRIRDGRSTDRRRFPCLSLNDPGRYGREMATIIPNRPGQSVPPAEAPPRAVDLDALTRYQAAVLYRAIQNGLPGIEGRVSRRLEIPIDEAAELIREGSRRLADYRRSHPEVAAKQWLVSPQVLTQMLG